MDVTTYSHPGIESLVADRFIAVRVDADRRPDINERYNLGGWPTTMKYDTVTVVTADGTSIVGVPINEDTFTVQVMDTSERVHSLEKRSLRSYRHEDRSLMPAYPENRLNATDLDDLVAYLQTLRAVAKKGVSP